MNEQLLVFVALGLMAETIGIANEDIFTAEKLTELDAYIDSIPDADDVTSAETKERLIRILRETGDRILTEVTEATA